MPAMLYYCVFGFTVKVVLNNLRLLKLKNVVLIVLTHLNEYVSITDQYDFWMNEYRIIKVLATVGYIKL